MRSVKALLPFVFMLCVGSAWAATKTDPDFLRQKHAGTATFRSTKAITDVYPELLQATEQCWAGKVAPGVGSIGTGGAAGGAMGVMSSASRMVSGELSQDQQYAHIAVTAVGFFGATKRNMLQIDLTSQSDGTNVIVYHGRNVKAQREFVGEVEKWIAGDLGYCEPKPFMSKKKNES